MSTTISELQPPGGSIQVAGPGSETLTLRYREIVRAEEFSWTSRHRKVRLLGKGGQGVVFLTERIGADGFACRWP